MNYFFYLRAVNTFGTSEQSEAALISTKGRSPLSDVRKKEVGGAGGDRCAKQWFSYHLSPEVVAELSLIGEKRKLFR